MPLVQQLRAQRTPDPVTGQPVRAWREWVAYSGLSDAARAERMTSGPLAGSAGLAAQVVFWNEALREVVVFVVFGPGTTGWPRLVHGGALSTVCDEVLGRVALRSAEKRTGVTATLQVAYLDASFPGRWYFLHAGLDKSKPASEHKFWVKGYMGCGNELGPQLKDLNVNMGPNGLENVHVHLLTQALFVVPKNVELQPIVENF